MKRAICLILLAVLVLSGCGKTEDPYRVDTVVYIPADPTEAPAETAATEEVTEPIVTEPAATEEETEPAATEEETEPAATEEETEAAPTEEETEPAPTEKKTSSGSNKSTGSKKTSSNSNKSTGNKKTSSDKNTETNKKTENTEDKSKKPAETKPAETKPAETKPEKNDPEKTKPAETKPEETKPAETKPVETEAPETEPPATEPPATEPEPTDPPLYDISGYSVGNLETAMKDAINSYRKEAGLGKLKLNSKLSAIASCRGYEISQVWSHTRPDGRGYNTVLSDYGYGGSAKELLVYVSGSGDGSSIVDKWMDSDSHRELLLGDYSTLGIGVYRANGNTYIACLLVG